MSSTPLRSEISPPRLFEASTAALCLESTLSELSSYHFQVESDYPTHDITQIFEQNPLLPGVIVLKQGQFLGMISRRQLLEFLIRPQGLEILLTQPLGVLHSYTRTNSLILPETTPILTAAQQVMRRSPTQQGEPIVLQLQPHTYRLLDTYELNIAYWQLRGIETQIRYERAQAQIIQTEKMASLGRLVDGVSQEILDPIGFIWGNLSHIAGYTNHLMQLLTAYEAVVTHPPALLANLRAEIELDYLRQDLPQSIASVKTGAERLKNLASSLQNFCHIDDVYPKPADLHECLDSILLLLLKSRLTGEIQVVRNYTRLPPVTCYAGQLSQALINILSNSIDALMSQASYWETSEFGNTARWLHGSKGEALQPAVPKPQITITTQMRKVYSIPEMRLSSDETAAHAPKVTATRWVSIRIANNGAGLSTEQRQEIMDAFLLENRAARETSLAVSYRTITAKHSGKLYVRSPIAEPNSTHHIAVLQPCPVDLESLDLEAEQSKASQPEGGTEFEILLPLF
jgi:signal transduction histidine kinase